MHEHSGHTDHIHTVTEFVPQFVLFLPFLIAAVIYLVAVILSNRKHKQWPISRTICWNAGVLSAITAVAGPLAEMAHGDFTVHMLNHIFLGMLAPLLMVVAAPMTLFLRTLPVSNARRLSKILKSALFRVITDPIVASLLNVGGLWILYTTRLFEVMHENVVLYVLIHFHVFLAGYVFSLSIIYIDPIPHRTSYVYRSIVLVTALAAHGILSKYIYANPPIGVTKADAEQGGMLMYYGGDTIDVMLIFILCLQWYRASRPRLSVAVRDSGF
ncbi:cytochrome c oxidase assembly protein [Halalkalibacter urbisdiaboli]|uniref:cytochrome c oxidase assembly protein n=1 Tax=Halalkalibacter urbisdiaboli TaxID=1960589 RepID=UPI000B446820|nr:cytochrome c oxidase assembly protein [Halalkalibacter urbisdiaboli]